MDLVARLFTFEGIGELLALPFVQSALIACAVLGFAAGALAPLIVSRGMAFAVHGTAELAFTGGAAALLIGVGVELGAVAGALVAGAVFGVLGLRQRERDSVIGVVLAFGLGLGVLMLALYSGRASNKFGLLTGSVVSIDSTNLVVLGAIAVLVIGVARGALPAAALCEHRPGRRARPRGAGPVPLARVRRPHRADHGHCRAHRRGDPRAVGDDRARRRCRAGDREPGARHPARHRLRRGLAARAASCCRSPPACPCPATWPRWRS